MSVFSVSVQMFRYVSTSFITTVTLKSALRQVGTTKEKARPTSSLEVFVWQVRDHESESWKRVQSLFDWETHISQWGRDYRIFLILEQRGERERG